jgi:hypothetical protein
MHRGRVVALGTPAELKAAVGGVETTLDDVFIPLAPCLCPREPVDV